jgi:hypothetical protein
VNFAVWLYYDWVVRRIRAAGPHRDVCFVRYEDVVARPEKELSRVLGFLGLAYEPAVAEGHGNREGVPDRETAWKGRALEPITTQRVGVFRRELTDRQIEILERMGSNALRSLGYPLVTAGQAPLFASFYLRLAYDLSRLLYCLPWRSLGRELLCRLADGRLPNSPSPPLFPLEQSCLHTAHAPAVNLSFSQGSVPPCWP